MSGRHADDERGCPDIQPWVCMAAEEPLYALGHPETIRGEGIVCSLSLKPPNVGIRDGYGAISRDFTRAIVGCDRVIQCIRITKQAPDGDAR